MKQTQINQEIARSAESQLLTLVLVVLSIRAEAPLNRNAAIVDGLADSIRSSPIARDVETVPKCMMTTVHLNHE